MEETEMEKFTLVTQEMAVKIEGELNEKIPQGFEDDIDTLWDIVIPHLPGWNSSNEWSMYPCPGEQGQPPDLRIHVPSTNLTLYHSPGYETWDTQLDDIANNEMATAEIAEEEGAWWEEMRDAEIINPHQHENECSIFMLATCRMAYTPDRMCAFFEDEPGSLIIQRPGESNDEFIHRAERYMIEFED
jgi:hypothetical protein